MKIKIKSTQKTTKDIKQYVLLDAASMGGEIDIAKQLNPDHKCLYMGKKAIELETVAPFLFSIPPESKFLYWLSKHPDRNIWVLELNSEADFDQLYQHFRKFLIVKTEEGKQLYFRFYDPRVLAPFLATCDAFQLESFFGPVESFRFFSKENKKILMQLRDQQLELLPQ